MSKKKEDAVAVPSDSAFPLLKNENPRAFLEQVFEGFGVNAFQLKQIRVPSGGAPFWTVEGPSGPEPHESLRGVILAIRNNLRKWWRVRLDDNDGSSGPPDCRSTDGVHGLGINSLDEGAEPSKHECSECPWAQFGSTRGPGSGQDCQQYALIFFLREGSRVPVVISAPPTSLNQMTSFGLDLIDRDLDPSSVVTELALTQDKRGGKDVSIITPRVAAELGKVEVERVQELSAYMREWSEDRIN